MTARAEKLRLALILTSKASPEKAAEAVDALIEEIRHEERSKR